MTLLINIGIYSQHSRGMVEKGKVLVIVQQFKRKLLGFLIEILIKFGYNLKVFTVMSSILMV